MSLCVFTGLSTEWQPGGQQQAKAEPFSLPAELVLCHCPCACWSVLLDLSTVPEPSGSVDYERSGQMDTQQDSHTRTTHYGSLPQKSQHGRTQDENPVVHFFKNIVTPRTPPPSQGKGAEGQKPGFGYGGRASDYKSAHKGFKGAYDAQGTLSKIFKLGGRDSRSGSPMARR